jgi:hypothetical protein
MTLWSAELYHFCTVGLPGLLLKEKFDETNCLFDFGLRLRDYASRTYEAASAVDC